MAEYLELVTCSFRMTVKTRNYEKHPVPTKRATVSMIFVIQCNLFLLRLLACICSYLNSVLRYKCLILHTYQPDTLY